jgi:hypothetical protein
MTMIGIAGNQILHAGADGTTAYKIHDEALTEINAVRAVVSLGVVALGTLYLRRRHMEAKAPYERGISTTNKDEATVLGLRPSAPVVAYDGLSNEAA